MKTTGKPTLRFRHGTHPLLKKGGAHGKTTKAQRQAGKRALSREVRDSGHAPAASCSRARRKRAANSYCPIRV